MPKCAYPQCLEEATGATGVELYPYKATQDFYKEYKPLTRLVFDLVLCDGCRAKLNYQELMQPQLLATIAHMIYVKSGTKVDTTLSKVVRVGLYEADYLTLLENARQQSRTAPQG